MHTLLTALLLAAQIAESDYSRFVGLMEMEREARHAARYVEAERLGREAETIASRLPESDDCLVLVWNELAIVLQWRGRYPEAINLLERALPLAKKLSVRHHLVTAVHLGGVYRALGRIDEAQALLLRALRAPGAGLRPEALAARSELAGIEALLGHRKAASALYSEVLAEQTRRLGRAHRDTLTTLSAFTKFSIAWKHYDQARKLALRYLDDNAQAETAGHPSNAFGHYHLALIDLQRKRYPEATERLHRALAIFENSTGRRNANVASVLDALASVEIKLGHLGPALVLRREAVSICEEALGPRNGVTALMLYKYADLQGRLHFRDEARQNKAKAVAIATESAVGSQAAGRTIEWETFRREAGR